MVPALLAAVLLAAAPVAAPASSAPPGSAAKPAWVSVVCDRAPLYVFVPGADRPIRAHTPAARLGQRFGLHGAPRTTLASVQFYETDVTVVEPGYPGAHYWIERTCAIPI